MNGYQHLLWSHRVCEVEFIFSEGSQASGQRVDGLAFVNEDVVGESPLRSLASCDPDRP